MSNNIWPFPHGKEWEEDLKRHLAKYFQSKGYKISPTRAYILNNRSDWRKNIISEKVSNYVTKQKDEHI